MAKASQAVILENEFYIIKAPNGKVLEVKNFNTENGAAIQLWSYAGHPWQQWQFVDAGEGRWRICNRAKEEFESDEGKALLRQWGIEGDWVGVGHCILGYPAADPKPAAPRKPDYIVKV